MTGAARFAMPAPVRNRTATLLVRPGRFNRFVELLFRIAQQLLGLGAMALHVVVVGGTRSFHFADRFDDVLVHAFQVAPVAHLGERQAGAQRDERSRVDPRGPRLTSCYTLWNALHRSTERAIPS
jgi:hypothetical protein